MRTAHTQCFVRERRDLFLHKHYPPLPSCRHLLTEHIVLLTPSENHLQNISSLPHPSPPHFRRRLGISNRKHNTTKPTHQRPIVLYIPHRQIDTTAATMTLTEPFHHCKIDRLKPVRASPRGTRAVLGISCCRFCRCLPRPCFMPRTEHTDTHKRTRTPQTRDIHPHGHANTDKTTHSLPHHFHFPPTFAPAAALHEHQPRFRLNERARELT